MITTPIRQLRINKDITQGQLSELCSVHQTVISKLENQINPPSLSLQFKLAFAFDMSLDELQRACDWPVTAIPQSSKAGGIR